MVAGGRAVECLINIDATDLEKAIAFYEQGVGLRLTRRLFGGTVAEMQGASSPVYLLTKGDGTPFTQHGNQRRDYRRHWTPVHLDFVVPDLDAAVHKALTAGAALEGKQRFAWGHLATLSDPFGHGLCFVQWIGRGYDEIAAA
jgi:predicted enzyme related to lactoylglutathione lyase